MELPEVVEFGRNFAAMVRVRGPDPKGLKMRRHAFHQYNSGTTTLSASGVLLPASLFDINLARKLFGGGDVSVVVTVASVVEQFLSVRYKQGVDQVGELIPGAQIDIMVEGTSNMKDGNENVDNQWFPAKVLTIVDVSQSALALHFVFGASSRSAETGWEVGWSLASSSNAIQNAPDGNLKVEHDLINGAHFGNSCATFAILGFSSVICEGLPDIAVSNSNKKGDPLLVMGSPFGILSPVHFLNSIAVGSISNFFPLNSSKKSLLMADIRSLPGIEGGPVYNNQRELIGIITRPQRQKSSGAEVQIVIPWEAIAASSYGLLSKESQLAGSKKNMSNAVVSGMNCLPDSQSLDMPNTMMHEDGHSDLCPPSPVDRAATSVCLITVDDGAWASGILLNNEGLVLTNAHLLEPWRFGKTAVTGGRDSNMADSHIMNENSGISCPQGSTGREGCDILPKTPINVDYPSSDKKTGYLYSSQSKGYRSIHVRLGQRSPWIWSYARVVYVSKGQLDVALLQLEYIPDQLCPIGVETICPSPGSQTFVIGHGLFGPRSGSPPSINRGVVAKVVRAKMNTTDISVGAKEFEDVPVMLETTASVHPGCSGGAVVNSHGCMIGLVTSNSRHNGGTVIPHLNFSIPCAAMKPIFEFSKDMQNLSLLHDLDKPDSRLSSIWSLTPPVSPKTEPKSLLKPPNKDIKGSRFMKFIAEKAHLSKISTEPAEMEKPPTEKIQSKL
ncbi:hypothetical protein QQ045_011525 [Rhodiola kirilowii]